MLLVTSSTRTLLNDADMHKLFCSGTNVKIAAVPSSVVVLNSDNFDEIVLDTTKDVLVEFYASWYECMIILLFLLWI